MGTRHLIVVYYKGEYRIAQYGQWDGYPDGQGLDILVFIRDPANVVKLQTALDKNMVYVPDEEELKLINQLRAQEMAQSQYNRQEQMMRALRGELDQNALRNLITTPVTTSHNYPSLSRDTGAKILKLVADATEPLPIEHELDFISDTLFCEWAYVVDLDARVFEVYSSDTRGQKGGRFEDMNGPGTVGKFALDHLPEDAEFVKQCMPRYDDEDEPEE